MAEPRYGGAYTPPEKEAEDVKPAIEAACHPKCASVWEIYKQCEERVAEKGGHCSGYYMDYYRCIDKCAVSKLFKETV